MPRAILARPRLRPDHHKANYQKLGSIIGVDLTADPTRPWIGTALKIMFVGMTKGAFTGKKLGDYFGRTRRTGATRAGSSTASSAPISSPPTRSNITPRSATRSDRERIPKGAVAATPRRARCPPRRRDSRTACRRPAGCGRAVGALMDRRRRAARSPSRAATCRRPRTAPSAAARRRAVVSSTSRPGSAARNASQSAWRVTLAISA